LKECVVRRVGISIAALVLAPALTFAAEPLKLTRLGVHEGATLAIAVHHDGKRAVSGGIDRKIAWWDLEQGSLLSKGCQHPEDVAALAFDGGPETVYSACGDRRLRSFDLKEGRETRHFGGHERRVFAVAAGGDSVFTAGEDGQIRRWPIRGGEPEVLVKEREAFHALAFDPRSNLLFAAGKDRRISRWDLRAKSSLSDLSGHHDAVRCLALVAEGRTLLSAGSDRTARAWDVRDGQESRRFDLHPEEIFALAPLGDDGPCLLGGANGTMVIWDWKNGREIGRQKLIAGVLAAAAIPATKRALVGLADGSVWTAILSGQTEDGQAP
jgi:WD40 repeat protein